MWTVLLVIIKISFVLAAASYQSDAISEMGRKPAPNPAKRKPTPKSKPTPKRKPTPDPTFKKRRKPTAKPTKRKPTAKPTPAAFVTAAVDKNYWLSECVPPFKSSNFSEAINYSNYYLREKEHGLCAEHLSCAFVDCAWSEAAQSILESSNMSQVNYNSIKNQLPPSNLPDIVSFPKNAKQLVSAVKAAGIRKTRSYFRQNQRP